MKAKKCSKLLAYLLSASLLVSGTLTVTAEENGAMAESTPISVEVEASEPEGNFGLDGGSMEGAAAKEEASEDTMPDNGGIPEDDSAAVETGGSPTSSMPAETGSGKDSVSTEEKGSEDSASTEESSTNQDSDSTEDDSHQDVGSIEDSSNLDSAPAEDEESEKNLADIEASVSDGDFSAQEEEMAEENLVQALSDNRLIRNVTGGALQGYLSEDQKVAIYKGIPYAAAPVGDLRWKAPQPVTEWEGVKECIQYSANPMQTPSTDGSYTPEFLVDSSLGYSEDCLYLNIWTKADETEGKKPVIVYIYGGAFVNGGSSCEIYDGEEMARKDVVYVSFNYRLGVFGFLAHPELAAESPESISGNYGLLDQIAALKWVQENIAQFGGDPSNVTVVGQSAGSACTELLAISPKAAGLFRNAVYLSYPQMEKTYGDMNSSQEENAKKFAGLSLADLRSKSAEEILTLGEGMWFPCVDGAVVPCSPAEAYRNGTANSVNVLSGAVPDDAFMATNFGVYSLLYSMFGLSGTALYNKCVNDAFPDYASECMELYPVTDDTSVLLQTQTLAKDNLMGTQYALGAARALCQTGNTYLYFYQYSMPGGEGQQTGSFHTSDVPYWLNHLSDTRKDSWTDQDRVLAAMMSSYLVNFAKTGDPNGAGLPEWRAYDGSFSWLSIENGANAEMKAMDDSKRGFWDHYRNGLLGIQDKPDESDNVKLTGLFEQNEEGFFKEKFALAMNPDLPYTVPESAYSDKEQGIKDRLSQVTKLGEIFESGRVEFYPDGRAMYAWKMVDEINTMLFGDNMLNMLLHPAKIELECTYTIDTKRGTACLTQTNGGLSFNFIIDNENQIIRGTYNFSDEPFTVITEIIEEVMDYTIIKDIAYGGDSRQVMDIYVPNNYQPSEKKGAFLSVYGGGWTSGNKEDSAACSHAKELANRGYIAATLSMRNAALSEDNATSINTVYDMVNDVQGCIAKLKEISEEKGWKVTQIALLGGSSGANVSMLYSYSRNSALEFSFDTFDTAEILPVRFVVDVVGPIDLHDENWADENWPSHQQPGYGSAVALMLTGGMSVENINENTALIEEYVNSVSPLYYVQQGQGIPTIMSYGGKDFAQNSNNGFYLQEALDEKEVANYLFYSPTVGHEVDPDGLEVFYEKILEYASIYFTTESSTTDDGGNTGENKPDDSGNTGENKPDDGGNTGGNKPNDSGNIGENKPDGGVNTGENKPDDGVNAGENKPNGGGNTEENKSENTLSNNNSESVKDSASEASEDERNTPIEYVVVRGDTLIRIAKRNHMTLSALLALNPQIKNPNRIYPGQKIILGYRSKTDTDGDVKEAVYDIVRKGDSLYKIAYRNGLSLSRLISMNPNLARQRYIYKGQRVRIK